MVELPWEVSWDWVSSEESRREWKLNPFAYNYENWCQNEEEEPFLVVLSCIYMYITRLSYNYFCKLIYFKGKFNIENHVFFNLFNSFFFIFLFLSFILYIYITRLSYNYFFKLIIKGKFIIENHVFFNLFTSFYF